MVGGAFYPVLVHRPAASLHASSPHSVALMQLRFASLAVTCLRRDLHPQTRNTERITHIEKGLIKMHFLLSIKYRYCGSQYACLVAC